MSPTDKVALALVVAMLLLSLGKIRAMTWIVVIALAFFGSGYVWRHIGSSDTASLFAGICDAAIVCAVLVFYQWRWELWIGSLFLLSLMVNILYLTSNLAGMGIPHDIYSITLEAINLIAIFTIGLTAAFQSSGYTNGSAFYPRGHILDIVRPFSRSHR